MQSDQVNLVQRAVSDAVLFPNIRARIIRIDDRLVQERLQAGVPDEDRELRREFNLTYRTDLLEGEAITAGIWQGTRTGEISVEEGFAERVNIRLGSVVEFLIQGVKVTFSVTSIRSADTSSGLPFFFFVLHPSDATRFPASWFGYAQLATPELRSLERVLAKEAPNISVLDTSVLGETVREVTSILLTLLMVITFPPLILATLLLVTLIATTFSGRQRDALRLRVLGATRFQTLSLYLMETLTTVIVMAVMGVVVAMTIVKVVTVWVLDSVEPVFFDIVIVTITSGLVVALLGYALMLLALRRRTIREEMTYEENI